MDINRICIITGGILSLVVFLLHTQFYRLFSWRRGLSALELNNRRILVTSHLGLLLFILFFGLISLFNIELLATERKISPWLNGGYALFWLWRAVWQHIYFVPPFGSKKTILHYLFIVLSTLLAGAYAIPAFNG